MSKVQTYLQLHATQYLSTVVSTLTLHVRNISSGEQSTYNVNVMANAFRNACTGTLCYKRTLLPYPCTRPFDRHCTRAVVRTDYRRLLIIGSGTKKSVTKRSCVTFPACEGTWRPMNSTLTAVSSLGRTQHDTACASLCDLSISQSPNLRSSSAMYPHWVRHRQSRSGPSDQISTIEACGRRSRTE